MVKLVYVCPNGLGIVLDGNDCVEWADVAPTRLVFVAAELLLRALASGHVAGGASGTHAVAATGAMCGTSCSVYVVELSV